MKIGKFRFGRKKDFRRGKLPEKYIVKILYKWNDEKFEDKYLKK